MSPADAPVDVAKGTLLLRASGLRKSYGQVTALEHGDLELHAGEVLGLIGDNGAGKSTLVKCITGAEVPDSGTIEVNGERVEFRSTQDARAAGIETVYQTLAVAPALDIATNLFLGQEIRRKGILGTVFRQLDTKRMRAAAQQHLDDLGIRTLQNINQSVETLSGGQRQVVSVARCVAFGRRIVILDEPTAALGVRESLQVLRMVTRLRDRGLGVIIISHDIARLFDVADRIQIMRLGRVVAVADPQVDPADDVVSVMTGARETLRSSSTTVSDEVDTGQ